MAVLARPARPRLARLGELDNAALGGLVLPVYGASVLDDPLLTTALAVVPFFLVVLLNLIATQ
ncbi:hypothetical protein VB779_12690 [Haloarculaceae archaeon H-GB11]|nr:hypothetical protein [Haloarculaceae archaeon H-GB11]